MILPSPPLRRQRLTLPADLPLVYAIGDVHGCHDALLALEARIRMDAANHRDARPLIIYLGDYVDRGPASSAVLEHLATERHGDGIERIALCGNHDDLFCRFLRTPAADSGWLDLGAGATMRSYGLEPSHYLGRRNGIRDLHADLLAAMPDAHVRLLETLAIGLTSSDRFFVHAGIRPGVALEAQKDDDLLWIREPFLSRGPRLPLTVIHGHTPSREPTFGPQRIGIDTGCFTTGRLTALRVTATETAVL